MLPLFGWGGEGHRLLKGNAQPQIALMTSAPRNT